MDRTDLLQRNYRNIKVAITMCGIFENVQRNLPEDIVEVGEELQRKVTSKQLTIGECMPSLRDSNPELLVL